MTNDNIARHSRVRVSGWRGVLERESLVLGLPGFERELSEAVGCPPRCPCRAGGRFCNCLERYWAVLDASFTLRVATKLAFHAA